MTTPKTIAQVRDEMAEEYADEYTGLCCDIAFKSGFDDSTKYHEEKYQELLADARKLRDLVADAIAESWVEDFDVKYGVSDDRQD